MRTVYRVEYMNRDRMVWETWTTVWYFQTAMDIGWRLVLETFACDVRVVPVTEVVA